MPGKRLRLVRSSTTFDDMTVLNEPLPARELRPKMDGPPPHYSMKVPMEVEEEEDYDADDDDDDDDASQPEILTLLSSSSSLNMKKKKKENEQLLGHGGNFLDRCNYCRKVLDEKDNIYMYSSLRAFCSSVCRKRQIVMDRILREGILYGRQSTKEMVSLERMKIHNLTTTLQH